MACFCKILQQISGSHHCFYYLLSAVEIQSTNISHYISHPYFLLELFHIFDIPASQPLMTPHLSIKQDIVSAESLHIQTWWLQLKYCSFELIHFFLRYGGIPNSSKRVKFDLKQQKFCSSYILIGWNLKSNWILSVTLVGTAWTFYMFL